MTLALDVLAQIIVSMCATDPWPVDQLFELRSLTLVTAASTISGAIAGIEPDEADRVRAVVLARSETR